MAGAACAIDFPQNVEVIVVGVCSLGAGNVSVTGLPDEQTVVSAMSTPAERLAGWSSSMLFQMEFRKRVRCRRESLSCQSRLHPSHNQCGAKLRLG